MHQTKSLYKTNKKQLSVSLLTNILSIAAEIQVQMNGSIREGEFLQLFSENYKDAALNCCINRPSDNCTIEFSFRIRTWKN